MRINRKRGIGRGHRSRRLNRRKKHQSYKQIIKKVTDAGASGYIQRRDDVATLAVPDNYSVYSNHNYDTVWSYDAIGLDSQIQDIIDNYQIWLNKSVNEYNAGISAAEWSITNTKYLLYKYKSSHTFKNATNAVIRYRSFYFKPRYDLPLVFNYMIGPGNPPATASTVADPFTMMHYQDDEVVQGISSAGSGTYQFRNYDPLQRDTNLTRLYKCVKRKQGIIRPGQFHTVHLNVKTGVHCSALFGAISGTTGSKQANNWFCRKKFGTFCLTQFMGDMSYVSTDGVSGIAPTLPYLIKESKQTARVLTIKQPAVYTDWESSGLTTHGIVAARHIISDQGTVKTDYADLTN